MNIQFNHIALRCENIDIMADFFVDVIGLEKGFRPPFTFPGFWLYSPENKKEAIIHIFDKGAKFSNFSSSGNNGLFDHIAFTRNTKEGYSEFIAHLKQLNIPFDENFVPDTNVK